MKHVAPTVRARDNAAYARMARVAYPYGDGQASRRIVEALLAHSG